MIVNEELDVVVFLLVVPLHCTPHLSETNISLVPDTSSTSQVNISLRPLSMHQVLPLFDFPLDATTRCIHCSNHIHIQLYELDADEYDGNHDNDVDYDDRKDDE